MKIFITFLCIKIHLYAEIIQSHGHGSVFPLLVKNTGQEHLKAGQQYLTQRFREYRPLQLAPSGYIMGHGFGVLKLQNPWQLGRRAEEWLGGRQGPGTTWRLHNPALTTYPGIPRNKLSYCRR